MAIATVLRNSNKTLRRYGPVTLAILGIAILDPLRGGVYFTLAPLFAVLALGIFAGGIVGGGWVGLTISLYSVYSLHDVSLIRAGIIIATTVVILALFATLRRDLDNTSMILSRLRDVDIHLTGTIARWHNLSEAEKRQTLEKIHHQIATILTLTIGWVSLANDQNRVQRDYDKDKTI